MGEQDGINFDPLFTAWPSHRYFPASAHFRRKIKPTIYFWRITDNGSPPPGRLP
jgi:hypothetical protein